MITYDFEEIILLKKIADYFKNSHKFSLAETITEEFKREVAKCPNYKEPEYVKDDLITIFSKHIKLKKRQSEIRYEKSLTTSRNIEYKNNPEKELQKRKIITDLNVTNIIRDDQSDVEVDIMGVSDEESVVVPHEVNRQHLQESSVLQVIDTNTVNRQRLNNLFTKPFTSTPLLNTNENRNPFNCRSAISNIKTENAESLLDKDEINFALLDDDDVIITNQDDSFHHNIYSASTMVIDDCNSLAERMSQYEKNFVKPSQSMASSQAVNESNETIKVEAEVTNIEDSDLFLRNEQFVEKSIEEDITRDSVNSSVKDDDFGFDVEVDPVGNILEEAELTNLDNINRLIDDIPVVDNNEEDVIVISDDVQESFIPLATIVPAVPEIVKPIGCEIATQCSQDDILLLTSGPVIELNKRKRLSEEPHDRDYKMKRKKLNRSRNVDSVDLDDDEDDGNSDLFATQVDSVARKTQPSGVHIDLPVHDDEVTPRHRSRESSLSSIGSLPDEPKNEVITKKKCQQSFKMFVPFKNDKKIDMERRILMTDGWLLWPTSLLSNSLRNHSESDLQLILTQYEDYDNSDSTENRKDLVNCCLAEMAKGNLIVRGYHASKKMEYFMKRAHLSDDLLQLYEIDLADYDSLLWNKNAGPKIGRRICAEVAPENVKHLLEVELAFVDGLLDNNN